MFVRHVPGCGDKHKSDPEKDVVDRKERPIVEEDTRPADEGCEHANCPGDSGDDELVSITDANNVGVMPYIEPCEEAENEGRNGIQRKLRIIQLA